VTLLIEMEIDSVALMGAVRNTQKPSRPIIGVNRLNAGLARIAGDGSCQAAIDIIGILCAPPCAVRISKAERKKPSVRIVLSRSQMRLGVWQRFYYACPDGAVKAGFFTI
jgi:hypothetical protein